MGLLIQEVEKEKKELGATGKRRSLRKELLVLLLYDCFVQVRQFL